MKFDVYARQMGFRWLQPGGWMPRGYNRVAPLLARMGWHFEIVNTRLPADEAAMRVRLRELCLLPKMSTFAIAALLNHAVSEMPAGQRFVNVGVWHGFTFLAGMAGNPRRACVGIDNFSQFGGPREAFLEQFDRRRSGTHQFFDVDYRDYFRELHSGPIGVYVYDGEHSYANQLAGLQAAARFLAPGALIFVDDTNTPDARRATLDFMNASPAHYRLLLDQPTRNNCHPTLWDGLMVLQRAS